MKMNNLYAFVTFVANRFDRISVTSKRPYMDLACDIKYDMEHNQHPYKTDKEFLAYVKTRLSGSDQMYALRTFKHNYRAWFRKQSTEK